MDRSGEEPLVTTQAAGDEIARAIRLSVSHLAEPGRTERAEAILDEVRRGLLSPEGIVVARRGDRLAGVIVWQFQAGRTAVVWPPRVVAGEPSEAAQELLNHAERACAARGVALAYAMLATDDSDDEQMLRSAGFAPLADLIYLASLADDFPTAEPRDGLAFEPCRPENHERLKRLVEATYEGTLDCPGLNGVRDIDDVLAGYRATGRFAAERWLLATSGGDDVGCLLLAEHADQDSFELVYMGIVPAARGKGWGGLLTRQAQWLTGQAGRSRLVLAVDAANSPALNVYAALGFRILDRRRVLLKKLGGGGAAARIVG